MSATPRPISTAEFIAGFEGFSAVAYWDVNHWRLGFGSDTEGPDEVTVVQGMTTTRERALQNLAKRIPQFQSVAKNAMGISVWNGLDENQKTAITSLVYNYGHLPILVRLNDPAKTAVAIRALGSANGGVNRKRRCKEADLYLTAVPAATATIIPAGTKKASGAVIMGGSIASQSTALGPHITLALLAVPALLLLQAAWDQIKEGRLKKQVEQEALKALQASLDDQLDVAIAAWEKAQSAVDQIENAILDRNKKSQARLDQIPRRMAPAISESTVHVPPPAPEPPPIVATLTAAAEEDLAERIAKHVLPYLEHVLSVEGQKS